MRSSDRNHDWLRYLAALAELRLLVKRNADDFVFANDRKGRIVYLFDSELVQLFMNPLSFSKSLTGFGLDTDSQHIGAATIMTAEFLFSRDLAGQGQSPGYLSPLHAEDVNDILERLKPTIRPGSVSESGIGSPNYEAKQFSRLMRDDLIRPLHLLPEATIAVLKPDARIVEAWTKRLSEVAGDASISPKHLRRYAETIAQLNLLNQTAEQSVQATKYVLITADRAMFNVYGRWFYRTGSKTEFVLRRAFQYSPILNAEQMSEGKLRSESVQQMGEAIDGLFTIYSDDVDSYWSHLAGVAFDDPELRKTPWSFGSPDGVEYLKLLEDRWSKAGHSAVALNAHWFVRHFERAGIAVIDDLIKKPSKSRSQILKSFERSLVDVETFHAKFVAAAILPSKKTATLKTASPEPLLMRSKRRTLREVIDADPFELSEISNANFDQNMRPWISLTRAACVAFRLGRWQTAAQWGQRALWVSSQETSAEHQPSELEVHELHYLVAAANKQSSDLDEYASTRSQLRHSLRFFSERDDAFGEVRTLLELADLATVAYLSRIDPLVKWDPTLTGTYIEAVDSIVKALKRYTAINPAGGRWAELRQLIISSFVTIAVLDHLLVGTGTIPADMVARARDELLAPANRQLNSFERVLVSATDALFNGSVTKTSVAEEANALAKSVPSSSDKIKLTAIARVLGS